MSKFDCIAIGELLIDFIEGEKSPQGNPMYEANPGGAPCNVLSMLGRLNKKTAFIGKVGNDSFGNMLKETIITQGIDATELKKDDMVHTTLAYVHKLPDGDRDFSFYRNPGADMCLTEDEIDENFCANTKIFHFGTLSMTHKEVKAATKKAVKAAKRNGAIISFDPNLRPPLWENLDKARKAFDWGMSKCDILKISDNEIQWFTGCSDYTEGVKKIRESHNIGLILVTMGKDGSRAYVEDRMIEMPAYFQKDTVDTTGAGDTFCACALCYCLDHGFKFNEYTDEELKALLDFGNRAASIVTTRKGALKVMPTEEEVLTFFDTP